MIELKPCPVCGQKAQEFFGYDYGKVGCRNDDCNYRNKPQHPDEWNSRPYENKIKADAVRDAIEHLYDECSYLDSSSRYVLAELASKIERGEL